VESHTTISATNSALPCMSKGDSVLLHVLLSVFAFVFFTFKIFKKNIRDILTLCFPKKHRVQRWPETISHLVANWARIIVF